MRTIEPRTGQSAPWARAQEDLYSRPWRHNILVASIDFVFQREFLAEEPENLAPTTGKGWR
jgi:hypothetical protein